MTPRLPLLAVLLAAAPAASAQSTQDFGNRFVHASRASVNSQFLAFPLPMTHWLKGRWQVGTAAGYSNVDGSLVDMKGPLASVGWSWAFTDRFGLYALGFFNSLDASGSGETGLVAPFTTGLPIANASSGPPKTRYENVAGAVKQSGGGLGLVWDPKASEGGRTSLPLFFGVVLNRLKITDSGADYTVLEGADAGQKGRQSMDGSYTFVMPFAGILYSRDLGKNIQMVPSLLVSVSAGSQAQFGRITGTSPKVFDLSGDTDQTGYSDAGFDIIVLAPGLTFIYRPWGIGFNVGATVFKAVATLEDGVDGVLTFNASWRFGDYER